MNEDEYFQSWKHDKFTGKKCVVCFDKNSHDTQVCQLCQEQIEFCNDCKLQKAYTCGEILRGHLEKEHGSVDLC